MSLPPDVVAPGVVAPVVELPGVVRLTEADAGEVLTAQRAAYVLEAQNYRDPDLPPLRETLEEVRASLRSPDVIGLGLREDGRLLASVRLRLADGIAHLGRLAVVPDRQGEGIGTTLLRACEAALPADVREIRLFTGSRSDPTIRLYERLGYVRGAETDMVTHQVLHLSKVRYPGR